MTPDSFVDIHGQAHRPEDLHAWLLNPVEPFAESRGVPVPDSSAPAAIPKVGVSLRSVLAIVFFVSALIAGAMAGAFWYGWQHQVLWMAENVMDKPLEWLEPFGFYSNVAKKLPLRSSDGLDPEIELGPVPSTVWDQWSVGEYYNQTGGGSPYRVNPFPATTEEMATRREAFKTYTAYLQANPSINDRLMVHCLIFDGVGYLLVFFGLGAGVATLIHRNSGGS